MPVAARSKALSTLLDAIWEDRLKHSPEFASSIGDKRYNDQLTDYSVKEVNASLGRGSEYIQRLVGDRYDRAAGAGAIVGGPDAALADRSAGGGEVQGVGDAGEPVQRHSTPSLRDCLDYLQFDSVKDYDDYIARLKKIPTAFSQIMTNMQLGMDEGRVPPPYLLEKVLVQTQTLADQKPEDSPFALPLKKFPTSVSAADQKRISTRCWRRFRPTCCRRTSGSRDF